MQSPGTQDRDGHRMRMPEIKKDPEDNDLPASETQQTKDEQPLPEFAFVKLEPEDPVTIECSPEIENFQESGTSNLEPTLPTRTIDNNTSQLDQETNESTKTQVQFDSQREVHIIDELNEYKCFTCDKEFSHKQYLRRHLLLHSDTLGRKYKCEECGKSFNMKGNLKQHKRIHEPPEYVCTHCNKAFAQKASFHRHLSLLHSEPERDHICGECGKVFTKKGNLTQHQRMHKRPGVLSADGNKAVPRKLTVPKNLSIHLKPKPEHICGECGKTFTKKRYLTQHQRVHKPLAYASSAVCQEITEPMNLSIHSEPQLEHVCGECGKTFNMKRYLTQHQRVHKSSGPVSTDCNEAAPQEFTEPMNLSIDVKSEGEHVCGECGECFTKKGYLTQHQQIHKQPGVLSADCNEAVSQEFMVPNSLLIHYEPQREHVCGECGKSFTKKRYLTQHQRVHKPRYVAAACSQELTEPINLSIHSESEGEHVCGECGKTFTKKGYLTQHKRMHKPSGHVSTDCNEAVSQNLTEPKYIPPDSEPNESCDACGKRFTTRSNLIRHLQLHKPPEYSCAYCGKEFVHKQNLENHVFIHMEKRERNHICAECGRRFKTKPHLKQHYLTHKPHGFVCVHCNMTYPRNDNLQRHLLTHSDKRDQVCGVCGMCFRAKRNLKQHQQKYHKPRTTFNEPPATILKTDTSI